LTAIVAKRPTGRRQTAVLLSRRGEHLQLEWINRSLPSECPRRREQ